MLKFYDDVLPDVGSYCVFLAATKENRWVKTISELKSEIATLFDRADVYYATESFKAAGTRYEGRKQANVLKLKCFRIDVDAGAEKLKKHGPDKVYADGHAALKALASFTTDSGLVFSYVVRSGTGLHVYYVLEKAITPDDWFPVASSLQAFCVQYGFKIDPAVTTDSARVLRPLGSMHPSGKEVKILKGTGKVYTLDEFAEIVGVIKQPSLQQNPHDPNLMGSADFERVKAGCDVVRWASEPSNQNNVEEPLWRGLLGIVKFCSDPNRLAHQVSECHSKYDSDETQQKLEGWTAGPTTCAYFAQYKPDLCAACTHVVRVAA